MRKSLTTAAAILIGFTLGFSEEPAKPSTKEIKNSALKNHLIENVDIFGKDNMPAIYLFGPGMDEMEGMLLTRDFTRDAFLMQNIDREEFEWKMALRTYSEDRKRSADEF